MRVHNCHSSSLVHSHVVLLCVCLEFLVSSVIVPISIEVTIASNKPAHEVKIAMLLPCCELGDNSKHIFTPSAFLIRCCNTGYFPITFAITKRGMAVLVLICLRRSQHAQALLGQKLSY
jgi:hypothetical protein